MSLPVRIATILTLIAIVQMPAAAQTTDAKLADYRTRIDAIDSQIVSLLNKRAAMVAEIGQIKKRAALPVAAPAREQQVLDHVVSAGKAGPLPTDNLRRIYLTILQEMRTWEQSLSGAK